MKRKASLLFTLFLLAVMAILFQPAMAITALAAPDTSVTQSIANPELPPVNVWQGLIPVVVPILIAIFKWFAPKIPKVALPLLAPVLGAALQLILHFSGLAEGGGMIGAVLGGLGVFVREAADQVKKLTSEPPSERA